MAGRIAQPGPQKSASKTDSAAKSSTKASSSHGSNSNNEALEVTVIPVDESPFSKHLQIPL